MILMVLLRIGKPYENPYQSTQDQTYDTGWWFGTCFFFPHPVGNVIIPIDFHIFQRGRLQQPTRIGTPIHPYYNNPNENPYQST